MSPDRGPFNDRIVCVDAVTQSIWNVRIASERDHYEHDSGLARSEFAITRSDDRLLIAHDWVGEVLKGFVQRDSCKRQDWLVGGVVCSQHLDALEPQWVARKVREGELVYEIRLTGTRERRRLEWHPHGNLILVRKVRVLTGRDDRPCG